MPGKIVQFQLVTLEGGSQVLYVLNNAGQLWFSNGTVAGGQWQLVEKPAPSSTVEIA